MAKKKAYRSALWIIKQVKTNWIIALVISVLILVIVVLSTIDRRTIEAIKQTRVVYLFIAFLLTIASYFLSGLAFNILANALGKKLSIWEGFEVFTGANFINLTTPLFNFANLPVKVYFLTNFGINYADASAIVAMHATLSIWFFLFAPLVVFVTKIPLIGTPIGGIFFTALIIIFVITFFFLFFVTKPRFLERILERLVNNRVIKYFFEPKKVEDFSERLIQQVELSDKSLRYFFKKAPSSLLVAFLAQVLSWLAIIATVPVILIGLNWFTFLPDIFFRVLVLNFIVSIAPTPGGSGVAEVGIVAVLLDLIPTFLIGPVVLLWRFITFYLPYGFSAIFFVILVNMRRKMERR